jgi:hypothetical protein
MVELVRKLEMTLALLFMVELMEPNILVNIVQKIGSNVVGATTNDKRK